MFKELLMIGEGIISEYSTTILTCQTTDTYDTPGLVLPIKILLIEVCCWLESYWAKGFSEKDWSHHSGSFSVAIMIWLTGTKYPFHRWQWISFDCHEYKSVPIPIVTKPRLWLLSNTTGATSGAGVANPSGAPELTLVFVGFVLLQL